MLRTSAAPGSTTSRTMNRFGFVGLPLIVLGTTYFEDTIRRSAGAQFSLDEFCSCGLVGTAMQQGMAPRAQRDQVFLGVVASLASKFLVVNLKVRSGSARLTSPAVAAQHLLPKSIVKLGIKPQTWLFGQNPIHEAFSATSCRKACR